MGSGEVPQVPADEDDVAAVDDEQLPANRDRAGERHAIVLRAAPASTLAEPLTAPMTAHETQVTSTRWA